MTEDEDYGIAVLVGGGDVEGTGERVVELVSRGVGKDCLADPACGEGIAGAAELSVCWVDAAVCCVGEVG